MPHASVKANPRTSPSVVANKRLCKTFPNSGQHTQIFQYQQPVSSSSGSNCPATEHTANYSVSLAWPAAVVWTRISPDNLNKAHSTNMQNENTINTRAWLKWWLCPLVSGKMKIIGSRMTQQWGSSLSESLNMLRWWGQWSSDVSWVLYLGRHCIWGLPPRRQHRQLCGHILLHCTGCLSRWLHWMQNSDQHPLIQPQIYQWHLTEQAGTMCTELALGNSLRQSCHEFWDALLRS